MNQAVPSSRDRNLFQKSLDLNERLITLRRQLKSKDDEQKESDLSDRLVEEKSDNNPSPQTTAESEDELPPSTRENSWENPGENLRKNSAGQNSLTPGTNSTVQTNEITIQDDEQKSFGNKTFESGPSLDTELPYQNQIAKTKEVCVSVEEEHALICLKQSHESLCQIMATRLQDLDEVSRLWTSGDLKTAVETASGMSDLSVLVHIVSVLTLKQAIWTLDICSAVLFALKSLFTSNCESHVETGSSSLQLIMKYFSPLIKNTLSRPPGTFGVREDRYRKCEDCYRHLIELRKILQNRTKASGRIGTMCEELGVVLSNFDKPSNFKPPSFNWPKRE